MVSRTTPVGVATIPVPGRRQTVCRVSSVDDMKRALMFVGAAVVVAISAVTACGTGGTPDRARSLQQALDAVVHTGFPGVQVVISEHGRDWTASAGVGDVATGTRFPDDGYIRIASITKPFVATTVLQLVSEGKADLDAPLDRYLPGIVRGNGNDGTRVTVRNLLQHTSGLPDYIELPEFRSDIVQAMQLRYETADLVARAMTMPSHFQPGEKVEYSSTNYLLAGMLVERITGQPVDSEITRRIIEPLGLHHTYYPVAGQRALRDPHPRGYALDAGQRIDATELDPSLGGPAGAIVSTGTDVNRFFIALLDGKLLPPTLLSEMKQNSVGKQSQGLGLGHIPVPCGNDVYGHSGGIPGFETFAAATTTGRAVTVTVNQWPANDEVEAAVRKVFDTAVCTAP
ncbi:serine hydrolase domain-containing protein [Nocardia sp. NPDC088792]|uniref:serine hydrolase domain-containing protein n=1 Tax=Nocardia sp. NPDC088792 TaxID=3364332 RepID=UPI003824DC13